MIAVRRDDLIFKIQRRVGFAGTVACFAIGSMNIVGALSRSDDSLWTILTNPSVYILFSFSFTAYLTTRRNWKWLRVLQVSVFLIYSYAASVFVEPSSLHGALFGIYGVVLSMQYGFLQRRFWLKISVLSLSYAAIRVVTAAETDGFVFYAAPDVAILVSLFVYLFWIIFAEEIHAYTHENSFLKAERDKNKVFVKFGRNISGVVHNLKSTLMSVDGCIDVLKYADKDARAELLQIQKSSTVKMLHMINNFMTAVRSYQRTEPEEVSLNRLIESSVEVLKGNRTLKHRLKIDLDLHTPDTVIGVPMEIMQVIDNIVTNAAEAMMGTDRYKLLLSTSLVDGFVCASVADEGVGIGRCEKCTAQNCLKCSQFDYGKSTKHDGVGVGMMYVRQIVSEMNGRLGIESRKNRGTTVKLFFPYIPAISGESR